MEVLALLDRIESYGFECEAGPLTNCVDWKQAREKIAALETECAERREIMRAAMAERHKG